MIYTLIIRAFSEFVNHKEENILSITVKSQAELDRIPLDCNEIIYIEFGTYYNPAIVRDKYKYSVVARENSSVVAWGNSSVVAWENSSVVAWENSSVVAWGNSSVVAWGNSSVEARENSSVEAWGNSSVVARGNSSVEARKNSSVVARENSSVVAWGNSSVVAWGNSSVVARGNSSVEAWGNSSVEANANVQVVDRLNGGRISLSGNARRVCMPKCINEFMEFYGIKHDKKKAIFYKAVHKVGNILVFDRDDEFTYPIGLKVKEPNCDLNVNEDCGEGIHISHLAWALDYGRNWDNLAIIELEVKIDDIVMPVNTDGKVRTSEAVVLREVPLEECGLFGKILALRRKSDE